MKQLSSASDVPEVTHLLPQSGSVPIEFTAKELFCYQILVTLQKTNDMRTKSVALGTYFEDFITAKISQGRYNNASEVIRAGLRLLEENEERLVALKAAIDEGMESGIADGFDPRQHLKILKDTRTDGFAKPNE